MEARCIVGDYANYGRDLFRAAGIVYVVICVIALLLALWLPKGAWGKVITTGVVLALALILPLQARQEAAQTQVKADVVKARYEKAKALFDERCKTAGEKIYRTVEDVDGVLLLKVRPDKINFSDQYAMNDPYGTDYGGDGYPASMLWGRNEKGELSGTIKKESTYKFVVTKPYREEKYFRFELGKPKSNGELETIKTTSAITPRFGVNFEDISSRIDRENWIAGSRLQVLDSKTGDVLGERIGWMLDPGLGDTTGGRSPWAYAAYNACPSFPKLHGRYPVQEGQTRNFVEKILKPIKGK